MIWLRFAFRNVLRNRRRSAVTALIAAVGAAALLVGGGFALFTYESLREAAGRESGHVVLAHREYFEGNEDVPLAHGIADHAALRRRLLGRSDVRAVLPRVELSGLISNGEKSLIFVGTGVDPTAEFAVRGPFLDVVAGGELGREPDASGAPEVMIGAELAHLLKVKPGGSLTILATTVDGALNAQDVVVKGTFTVGVPEIDKRAIFVHLATAQKLLLSTRVSTLSVYLEDLEKTDAVQAELRSWFPTLATRTWLDEAFYYRAVRSLYDRIFGMLGVVLVVMVLFATSNTLGMAILERTREIGTLRAMGSMPGEIIRNFVLEGAILSGGGTLVGMLLAVALSVGFDVLGVQMPPPPGRSQGYPLHVNLSAPLFAVTLVTLVLAAVLAALVVSRRVTRLSVVEALSHV